VGAFLLYLKLSQLFSAFAYPRPYKISKKCFNISKNVFFAGFAIGKSKIIVTFASVV